MTVTSLIVPVRNGERFIADALASVRSQLQTDDEILVVDDGSTDNTLAVVEQINDPRIKILPGLAKGVSSARNIGIDHASGEFICFLDHDDLWPEGRHTALLNFLRSQQDHDAIYGRIRVIFEADAPLASHSDMLDGKYMYALVATGLYRRELIDRVGRFDEDMHFGEDTDFSIRLGEAGMRAFRADIVSLIYRRHAGNASNDAPKIREGNTESIIRKLRRNRQARGPQ